MFNPRARANAQGWLQHTWKSFEVIAKDRKPVAVLHHPHTTVKIRTWSQAWHGLRKAGGAKTFSQAALDFTEQYLKRNVRRWRASARLLGIVVGDDGTLQMTFRAARADRNHIVA
jgi:hypothetical protein